MEQLSLFTILNDKKHKKGITFPSEIQEELILVLSQAIMEVYRKERDENETDENS